MCDGAIGTMAQTRGLPLGRPPEELNLTHPETIMEIHRDYLIAGAHIITTNTFGATRVKLAQFGLDRHFEEINRAGVALARKIAGDAALVAASIGPTGELLQPMGILSLEDAQKIYSDQIAILKSEGADFCMIETMGDLGELLAAVRACCSLNFPFMASMSFDANLRSLSGSSPEVAAVCMEPYFPLAIGSNCGLGPSVMISVVKRYAEVTHLPILVQPNSGLPQFRDGKTEYDVCPGIFSEFAVELAQAGASIIGGCCGTTPDHISKAAHALKSIVPVQRHAAMDVRFAARSGIVEIGFNRPFGIIGERINPTGRKTLAKQLASDDFSMARDEARKQVEMGASLLDVNVGIPDVDESRLMARLIAVIQGFLPDVPLSIDSNDPETLRAGLNTVIGRPLLNSISGESQRLDELLPIVKEFGTNFIALAIDEKGIPDNWQARMAIIQRILQRAEEMGIQRNRILVDCLVLTVASQPHQPMETLQAVEMVRKEFGCATILGISNISFGLPQRHIISSTFLAMAIQAGLTAGIVNPLSVRMMETIRSGDLLKNRDHGAKKYISFVDSVVTEMTKTESMHEPMPTTDRIVEASHRLDRVSLAIMDGNKENISDLIMDLIHNGESPEQVLSSAMIPAIQEIGQRYGHGEVYLPQLILAGETMREGVHVLRPLLKTSESSLHATPVILGTVSGDIHDIGKNIVSIVLENHGFSVIDLGKDVEQERFEDAIRSHRARLVGLSALMTTTLPAMAKTVAYLKSRFPEVAIMVGGAVLTQTFAKRIGADGYAKDAVTAGLLAAQLAGLSLQS